MPPLPCRAVVLRGVWFQAKCDTNLRPKAANVDLGGRGLTRRVAEAVEEEREPRIVDEGVEQRFPDRGEGRR